MSAAVSGVLRLWRRASRRRSTLRTLPDLKGQALIDGVIELVDAHQPIHVSIVGGEPLVRYRELDVLLPRLAERGHLHAGRHQRRAADSRGVGGDQAAADLRVDRRAAAGARRAPRRRPPTIASSSTSRGIRSPCTAPSRGSRCSATATSRNSSATGRTNPNARTIWISLYTPQIGEVSDERLTPRGSRARGRRADGAARALPEDSDAEGLLKRLREPPRSPDDCVFAQTTDCVSADLETQITPCQFGGNPDCAQCGCIASAGLKAVAVTGCRAASASARSSKTR